MPQLKVVNHLDIFRILSRYGCYCSQEGDKQRQEHNPHGGVLLAGAGLSLTPARCVRSGSGRRRPVGVKRRALPRAARGWRWLGGVRLPSFRRGGAPPPGPGRGFAARVSVNMEEPLSDPPYAFFLVNHRSGDSGPTSRLCWVSALFSGLPTHPTGHSAQGGEGGVSPPPYPGGGRGFLGSVSSPKRAANAPRLRARGLNKD